MFHTMKITSFSISGKNFFGKKLRMEDVSLIYFEHFFSFFSAGSDGKAPDDTMSPDNFHFPISTI